MRRTSASLVAGALVAALAWSSGPSSPAIALDPSPGVADLTQDLNQILADSRLTIGRAGVVVRSADSGEELYATDAGKLLIPASNTKLFTSAAAVETLGLDYRFATTVLHSGRKLGSVLNGDLVLRGTGDPTMLAEDYDALAAQVADGGRQGGRPASWSPTTPGSTRYASATDWAWDDETAYYAAQISALTASPDTRLRRRLGDRLGRPADGGKLKVSTTPPRPTTSTSSTGRRSAPRPTCSSSGSTAPTTVVISGTVAGLVLTSGWPWTTPPATPPRCSARRWPGTA